MMKTNQPEHLHKIVLIGESMVGKTTIVNSLQDTLKSKQDVLSCAVRFVRLEQENKKLQMVFWDSKSSSDTLLKLCLRNVEIIAVVLDAQKLLNDFNQLHTVVVIKTYKQFIDSHLKDDCESDHQYQMCIFVNKMDLIGEPIDDMMDRILFQTGIRYWTFGSALMNNVQSLIDMCSKILVQTKRKETEIVFKWSWLQFIIRNNLSKQFFIDLRHSHQANHSKVEHHIPVRMPQVEFEANDSPTWVEMEQVTKRTCYDAIEQNLGKRTNILVSVNKIPRPNGVEQSRFTILISLWFDCVTSEAKPIKNTGAIEESDAVEEFKEQELATPDANCNVA